MQKETISQSCWKAVNGAMENPKNWGLFEGFKRERSLKVVETHSKELVKTKRIGAFLRDAKGNGL